VAGADIGFTERGKRDLKGLTEGIDLFAVTPPIDGRRISASSVTAVGENRFRR